MKTAWIFPGGSARSVYTAGVIYALSKMDVPKPDIIIGCSGSAGTSLCYVANQPEVINSVWCKSLSTPDFLSFKRFWKILNIDYLVDVVLKQQHPLDMETINDSPITVYFPVTDSKTGKIEYLSNKMGVDLYEGLRAAISVPFWTNLFSIKGNLVNGKYYSDTPPGSRYQLHVQKAIKEGATKIVVFDSWHPNDNPTGYLISKLFCYVRNKEFRRNQMVYFNQIEHFTAPNDIDFLKLMPQRSLSMSRWETDNQNANTIFKQGYDETIKNQDLQALLS